MAKSDVVQAKFRELIVDPTVMSTFHITTGSFEPFDYDKHDELLGLVETLNDMIKDIIETKLTDRQRVITRKIFFEKKTQMEVADSLGLCQTTIHKVLHGNINYFHGGKRYGGAMKKIKKLCETDPTIKIVLDRISELRIELADHM